MSKISLSTLAAALMMTGAAFAQTGTGTGTGTSTGSGAAGGSATSTTTTTTTTITPQQDSTIKTYVTKEKTKSVAVPSGFTLSTGATVPQTVELHSFGSDVGITQYRYVVMNNRTGIADPSTRTVIKVIDSCSAGRRSCVRPVFINCRREIQAAIKSALARCRATPCRGSRSACKASCQQKSG